MWQLNNIFVYSVAAAATTIVTCLAYFDAISFYLHYRYIKLNIVNN